MVNFSVNFFGDFFITDFGGLLNGFRLPGAGNSIYPTALPGQGILPGAVNSFGSPGGLFGGGGPAGGPFGPAGGGGGNFLGGAFGGGGGPGFGGGFFGRSQVGGSSLANYNPNLVSDCPTNEHNRTGICVSNPLECRNRGGRIVGQCFANPILGSSASGSSNNIGDNDPLAGRRIPVGLCCVYQITCGGTILQNGTYFRSPNSPATYNDARACTASIPRLPPFICQVRLDFVNFNLKPPTGGECDVDKLIIDGQSQNNVIPPLCGLNNGQHLYIDVTGTNNPITITILTGVGSLYNRNFDIRVTMIHCASPFRAPPNCLQYYYDLHGEFKSFNFDYYQQSNARYLKDLDYAICFRKIPGFCSITYSMPKYGVPVDQDVQAVTARPGGRYFNIVNQVQGGIGTGGAGPVKCPDDFLILGLQRFCGSVLNDDFERASSPTVSEEITDSGSGPLIARFRTNSDQMVGLGFLLQYRLNHCFFGG